jgi:tripartite-type tricarboxylate transporter receptor subunit TctC
MLKSARLFCATVAAFVISPVAVAQQVPLPPLVRLVVPFSAGAGTDVAARVLAPLLSARLGTNVVVDNRPGASGVIGSDAVAKGPADGSMLLFTSVSLITTAASRTNMPFDVNTALVPVALLGQGPMLVAVSAHSDIRTPADLIAAARTRAKGLTHGTGGIGTIAHMTGELLGDAAKIQITHIPYKGAAPAVTDLIAGNIDVVFAANSSLAPQIKGGRVRPIAVTTLQPSPAFPGVPPMASAVPGFKADLWQAVFAPAATPAPLVQRLHRELNEVLKTKEMQELLQLDGFVPLALSQQELVSYVRKTYADWKKLATDKHIAAD